MIPITNDLLERLIECAEALCALQMRQGFLPRATQRVLDEATALLSQHNHETDKNEGE